MTSDIPSPPTLLLLHGLGATSGLWANVLDRLDWSGRVITPDLSGHGNAPATGDYTLGALAAAVSSECENGEEVIAVGHSLGGCVALCLASGFFRPVVQGVVAVGVKISWSDQDVAGMAKVAAKGVRWFDSRDEAVERFLRQAGFGLDVTDHPAVSSGVRQVDGRWCVSQDPMTFAQRPLDMAALMAAATCPVILGAGEHDSMVSRDELAAHTDSPRIAAGAGHNAAVDDPDWFAALVREIAG